MLVPAQMVAAFLKRCALLEPRSIHHICIPEWDHCLCNVKETV